MEELKARIPPTLRRWDQDLRAWFIRDEARALDLIADLEWHVGGPPRFYAGEPPWLRERAEWIERRGWEEQRTRHGSASRAAPAEETGAYAVLHLTPDAPPELVQAAYRALAKLHHPDAGGDEQRMKAINNAYEELTQ